MILNIINKNSVNKYINYSDFEKKMIKESEKPKDFEKRMKKEYPKTFLSKYWLYRLDKETPICEAPFDILRKINNKENNNGSK